MRKIILCVLMALSLSACHTSKPMAQPPQGVQTEKAALAQHNDDALRFSSVIMPDSQVVTSFNIPGYISALGRSRSGAEFDEGDFVSRGTVLAHLRSSEYEDKVKQAASQTDAASAAAEKARLDVDRANRLYEKNSLTKPDYDAARAQYDATQAQLRGAQAKKSEAATALHDTALRAPLTGFIIKKMAETGSFVGPGVPVYIVAATDVVKLTFGVPDITVATLKLGMPVALTSEAMPGHTFQGRISRIAAAADQKTRNFDIEVTIPNRDHQLRVGMIAMVQLGGEKPAPTVPLVPLAAITQANGGYAVFKPVASGSGMVAKLAPVEVGAVQGGKIEILKGVSAGETVITSGANLLKDGQAVEVLR